MKVDKLTLKGEVEKFCKKLESDIEIIPNERKEKPSKLSNYISNKIKEGRPFVFGCDFRLSLPFEEAKEFDETELEIEKYDQRVSQIGREMLFVISQVKA